MCFLPNFFLKDSPEQDSLCLSLQGMQKYDKPIEICLPRFRFLNMLVNLFSFHSSKFIFYELLFNLFYNNTNNDDICMAT